MIANTIELIATTDRVGIENFFSQTEKSHNTYEAVKEQIRTDPELAAMLQHPSLTPEQKQQMLDRITAAVMVELGFTPHDNLLIATDATTPSEDQFFGFYSEHNGNAYVNDVENTDTRELVTTAGHEAIHAMDHQSGILISSLDSETRQDINHYATNFGENLADYADFALDLSGYGGLAVSNDHFGNKNEVVLSSTREFGNLKPEEGDFYCANSFSCYGKKTENLFRHSQTSSVPIALLSNYQIREKVNEDGLVVGYEAYNPDTKNIIVMKPDELPGFVAVVEEVPFVGFSLETMSIAEHSSNNALFGLHDDGYVGGVTLAWEQYLSDPNNYVEAIIGLAGGGASGKVFRSNKNRISSSTPASIGEQYTAKRFESSESAYEFYSNKVKNLNVSSNKNGAVYYSGPGNRELAEQFANENRKTILEMTPGGKWLENESLFGAESPVSKAQAAAIWKQLSERYARNSSGNAVGFVKGAKADRTFNTVEYPALISNPKITNVITGGD